MLSAMLILQVNDSALGGMESVLQTEDKMSAVLFSKPKKRVERI